MLCTKHCCAFTLIVDIICKCSGVSHERRKSLPSPSTESNQDEDPFRFPRHQAVLNFGNICPGDAPLPIRPYHAIIEGTDKWVHSFLFSFNPSILYCLSRFRSQGQQPKQGSPDSPPPSYLIHSCREIKGKVRGIAPPAFPKSFQGPLTGGPCPEHLSMKVSRRHPNLDLFWVNKKACALGEGRISASPVGWSLSLDQGRVRITADTTLIHLSAPRSILSLLVNKTPRYLKSSTRGKILSLTWRRYSTIFRLRTIDIWIPEHLVHYGQSLTRSKVQKPKHCSGSDQGGYSFRSSPSRSDCWWQCKHLSH